jgi:hypothetical protein
MSESLHEFKMQAFKRMRKMKRDMDWCSDFDEILSEIGLNNAIPEPPAGAIVRHPRYATTFARRDPNTSTGWVSSDPYIDGNISWDDVVKHCEMHPVTLCTPDSGYGYNPPAWDAE